jgi:hypothetical protein
MFSRKNKSTTFSDNFLLKTQLFDVIKCNFLQYKQEYNPIYLISDLIENKRKSYERAKSLKSDGAKLKGLQSEDHASQLPNTSSVRLQNGGF